MIRISRAIEPVGACRPLRSIASAADIPESRAIRRHWGRAGTGSSLTCQPAARYIGRISWFNFRYELNQTDRIGREGKMGIRARSLLAGVRLVAAVAVVTAACSPAGPATPAGAPARSGSPVQLKVWIS